MKCSSCGRYIKEPEGLAKGTRGFCSIECWDKQGETRRIMMMRFKNWMFDKRCEWTCFKTHILCRLWELRGLQSCPQHGFYRQSWITGKCRKCKEEN